MSTPETSPKKSRARKRPRWYQGMTEQGGRRAPRQKVDLNQVEGCGSLGLSINAMASVLALSPSTVSRFYNENDNQNDFFDAYQKGYARLRSVLSRAQLKAAKGGNPTLLIWLGKQHLDQSDGVQKHLHYGPGTLQGSAPVLGALDASVPLVPLHPQPPQQ